MFSIDINCDMGEGMDNDAFLMPYISSANIACGYHAGDEDIMKRTIELAMEYKVSIGAHPGFADKKNFGRTEIRLKENEYYDLVFQQLLVFKKNLDAAGAIMHHVKPHGALYNMAAKNAAMASIIANAVHDFDPGLIFYGLSDSFLISEAVKTGLRTASEVFADRTYQDDGSLTPRMNDNALIKDDATAIRQVMQMIKESSVSTVTGKKTPITAETICIHGDGEHAITFAKTIHSELLRNGIVIRACAKSEHA